MWVFSRHLAITLRGWFGHRLLLSRRRSCGDGDDNELKVRTSWAKLEIHLHSRLLVCLSFFWQRFS